VVPEGLFKVKVAEVPPQTAVTVGEVGAPGAAVGAGPALGKGVGVEVGTPGAEVGAGEAEQGGIEKEAIELWFPAGSLLKSRT